jgi:tryptophanyl-tRNA synthetase
MIAELTPIRERAAELVAKPAGVRAALRAGAERARAIAQTTMADVRRRMGFLSVAGDVD